MNHLKLWIILFFAFSLMTCSATRGAKKTASEKKGTAFTSAQKVMIMDKDTLSAMRIFLITNKEDSILLRTPSLAVNPDPNNKLLHHLVKRMYQTVTDSMAMGVGIAAPQVGVLKNIILVQRFDKAGFPFEAYLNPNIIQYSKKTQPCPEGCLSIPGKMAKTQNRAYAILLEYDRLDGSHQIEMVEDFTAVVFQHEIDHLHGILFIDHLKEEIEDAKKKGK